MTEITWRFLRVRPAGVSQDPTQREFFGPEEGVAGALVREALQNSLDARPQSATAAARVRFHLSQHEAATFGTSQYFDGLRTHLAIQFPDHLPQMDEAVSYLTIEDFGTRGLEGDPSHSIYEEQRDERNDFFYFWRNVGRSRKGETERGRWGLGKTVFPASSKISAFFGLTIRQSDQRPLLMGQCVGTIHTLTDSDGTKRIYEPYGFWGAFGTGDDFALPVETPSMLAEFRTDFGLHRVDEPGLSVVVPFPSKELTPEAIAAEVIRSYYIAILAGEIEVLVSDDVETIEITKNSVLAIAESLNWTGKRSSRDEICARLAFASRVQLVPENDIVVLLPQPEKKAPESLSDRIPEQALDALRQRYESGDLIGFQIPVLVKKQGGVVESHFYAFVQRDETRHVALADYVRQGLAITKAGKLPRHPVSALALVRDSALSTLLGDAENPAHTKWQELADKVKEPRYVHGPRTVRLVNHSLQQLCDILAYRPEVRDVNLLSDIFFLPSVEESRKPFPLPTKPGGGETVPPEVVAETRPQPVTINHIKGGFRIDSVEAANVERVEVTAAYSVRSGDPFKRYIPFDFTFSTLKLQGAGIEITLAAENRLVVRVIEHPFKLSVTGFDERRDLEVRVKPVLAEDVG